MKSETSAVTELTSQEVQSIAGGCLSGNCCISSYSISAGNGGPGGNGGDINGIASTLGPGVLKFWKSCCANTHLAHIISKCC